MPTFPCLRAGLRLALAGVAFFLALLPGEAASLQGPRGGKAVPTTIAGPKGAASTSAPSTSKRSEPADVTGTAEPKAAWTSGEQTDRACFRGRRKLWDGEGWVVKKVNVCP